jgi:signal transduction histidine kinase
MRERALLIGGNLALFSALDEGTTIELTMGAT